MGEDLDGEVAHAHLAVEVLELALYHNVERLEEQRVEVGLDFLFALVLLELFELLRLHTYAETKKSWSESNSVAATYPSVRCRAPSQS